MILHCTPPYTLDIPNPAIGYLKGFLKAQGIPVKNIYWNAVLASTILNFQRNIKEFTKESELNTDISIVMFLSRHLLADFKKSNQTPLDMYFSSVLTNHETHQIVKSVKDQIDQVIMAKNLHKACMSGFTVKTYQWPLSFYVIRRLKELNPETKIVVGGITNEKQGRTFMDIFTPIDFAIWGEGEYPLFHLVSAVRENGSYKKVPNLVYREGDTIVSTMSCNEYPPLDDYPFADHSDYFTFFKKCIPHQTPTLVPIWGSRSCPWNKCKFCVLNEEYSHRLRSPENIVEEIEYQSKKHGASNFYFVDTEFPGNRKRFKTLLQLLIKSLINRKKSYHFYGEVSPFFIDDEIAQLLRIASFVSIQLGFEAMTDSLLEKMQKRHRFAHNIHALKIGNQYDLNFRGLNIIRGIPSETFEDVMESSTNVKFLRFLLKRYILHPNVLKLFKGSPFYHEFSEKERESWRENIYWEEIAPSGLVSEGDRFEFFGFNADSPVHHSLWRTFEEVIYSYRKQERSYKWIEYAEGSFIEEKGPRTCRCTLDRDETDVLIFCDSIKTFDELKKRFPHIGDDNLLGILGRLKEAGMVYYDAEMRTIISIVEAWRRKVTSCDV